MHTEDKYMINDQVCVGIPTYQPNIEKLIKTINSVIDQDYKNVSIIISENSPKNNEVKDLVESFKQKNIDIKYFGQENFLPQVENWDFCFNVSRSEYTTILGDDDLLSINYISSSIKKLQSDKKYIGVSAKWQHISENGKFLNEDKGFFYEDEKSYTRIKKFLFNEEDTYVNGIWRTEKIKQFGFKNSIFYYWWPNNNVIQQLFTQFLFTCILNGKGYFNKDAIYFHTMADGRRGFKADFNEGNRHKKNTYGITFVNFFKTSLFGYLRHFNLWFNYLRLTARHDLKFFPIYLFLILITYLYAEYRYTRKILRKLKNYFFKKERLY